MGFRIRSGHLKDVANDQTGQNRLYSAVLALLASTSKTGFFISRPMNVARVLLPRVVRRNYTVRLGAIFTLVTVVTLAFGWAMHQEVLALLETGEAAAVADAATSAILGLVVLTVINLGLVAATVGGNTAASLSTLSTKASRMGDGDLEVDLETRREDEIGDLYTSFEEMRSSLKSSLEETEEARKAAEDARERAEQSRAEAEAAREDVERERERLEAVNADLEAEAERFSDVMARCAEGDLTARMAAESDTEAMVSIAESFNEMMDGLESLVGRIQGFAVDVSEASRDVRSNAERVRQQSESVEGTIAEISDGATVQTEMIQEIAREMDDISATTEEMAASAAEVAQTSTEAARASENGLETAKTAIVEMNEVEAQTDDSVAAMETLHEEIQQIGEVTEIIADIAEQTNLLALNASIEAAHADRDGEGFAVVASEVKSLAEETKEATGDIAASIERIQAQTETTVEDIRETSDRISRGVDTVEETADSLERIVEAVEEANTGIQEINTSTDRQADSAAQVVSMVDDVANISETTADEATEVATAAATQSEVATEVFDRVERLADGADTLLEVLDEIRVSGGEATASPSLQQPRADGSGEVSR